LKKDETAVIVGLKLMKRARIIQITKKIKIPINTQIKSDMGLFFAVS
jgi:hypothetical protein